VGGWVGCYVYVGVHDAYIWHMSVCVCVCVCMYTANVIYEMTFETHTYIHTHTYE